MSHTPFWKAPQLSLLSNPFVEWQQSQITQIWMTNLKLLGLVDRSLLEPHDLCKQRSWACKCIVQLFGARALDCSWYFPAHARQTGLGLTGHRLWYKANVNAARLISLFCQTLLKMSLLSSFPQSEIPWSRDVRISAICSSMDLMDANLDERSGLSYTRITE